MVSASLWAGELTPEQRRRVETTMVELQFSMGAFVCYRAWLRRIHDEDPEFFTRLVKQPTPRIGCSDGRVPANEIVGLDPGEVFAFKNLKSFERRKRGL